MEFYGHSNEFQAFGKKLSEFPKSVKDKASDELGEKGDSRAYYLLTEASYTEDYRRTTLKIEATHNGIDPSYYESTFEIEARTRFLE